MILSQIELFKPGQMPGNELKTIVPPSAPTIGNTTVSCSCGQIAEPTPTNRKYKTIVIDPPWNVQQGSTWKTRFTDKARPHKHYSTMSLDELRMMELPMDKQSHVYIWVVNQHINWGYDLAKHWELDVIQFFTWCKNGLGVGQFQCNSEHVLVCRKGSRHGNPFGKSGGTYFNWDRGKHSEKPSEFYQLVEKISPAPYLDVFARCERKGWDVFGNEVSTSIKLNTGNNYS